MKNIILAILIQLFLPLWVFSQESSGKQLLEKAGEHFAENKDSALVFVNRAIRQAKANNDTTTYYESNLLKTYLLKNTGSKTEALKLARKMRNEARRNQDKIYEGKYLKMLGEINRSIASLEASLSFFSEALKTFRNIQDEKGIAETYNRLAATYYELSDFNKARQYADSSLHFSKTIADSSLLGSNYEILGAIYSYKRSDKGLYYLQKARDIYQTHAPNDIPNVLTNIMLHYERKGEYEKAIELGKQALKLSRKLDAEDHIENTSMRLHAAYKEKGDYKNALKYLQIHLNTKVNLYNQTRNDLVSFYHQRFEAEKKQHQIEMQKRRLQQEETQQKYYLAGMGVLLLFLAGGAFAYVKIIRKNKTMRIQKEKIEEQQAKIMKQNEALQSTNQELERANRLKQDMTDMLVHDLKNPLNIVVNLAEKRLVKSAGHTMNNLVMNMLDVNKYEEDTLTPELAECNLNRLISGAVEQVQFFLERKELTLENNIPDDIYVHADEKLITRVFVNLLTNAIKHSEENMPVVLSLGEQIHKQGNSFIEVLVTDYGTGISEEHKNKIFDRYFGGKINSHQLTGTGLGLAFCKMAVEIHNGTIGVESELEKYSRFYFTLPMIYN
ncbi:MAG: ATP-binding protein [Bacteroidales bacterium]